MLAACQCAWLLFKQLWLDVVCCRTCLTLGPVPSSQWPRGKGPKADGLGSLLMAGMDFAALTEGVAALPPAALYLVGTVVFLLALAALRVITNQLSTKAPPTFEGIPFVGGIIKFVQARAPL